MAKADAESNFGYLINSGIDDGKLGVIINYNYILYC